MRSITYLIDDLERGGLLLGRHNAVDERRGSLVSFVARGTEEEIHAAMQERHPTFFETVPLTLEEIFISEMEDKGYDFSKLVY